MSDLSQNEVKLQKLDRRDKAIRVFEIIILFFLVVITLFALISIRGLAEENRKNINDHRVQVEQGNIAANAEIISRANINRAKLDIGLCIISVSPTLRTPEYVKGCYDKIEKSSELKIDRFGDGVQ